MKNNRVRKGSENFQLSIYASEQSLHNEKLDFSENVKMQGVCPTNKTKTYWW